MNGVIIALLAAAVIAAALAVARRSRRGGGCCGEHETVRRTGVADRNPAHYPHEAALDIGGMTCDNCARRVENALNGLDGVWATVRIDSRSARVRCKVKPDEAALRSAVRAAGYVVTGYREVR